MRGSKVLKLLTCFLQTCTSLNHTHHMMDSLLCDEVWLNDCDSSIISKPQNSSHCNCMITTEEERLQAFSTSMNKEVVYMPDSEYANHLKSCPGLVSDRARAMHWLVRSRKRLDVSYETVFNAANYLDRFLSLIQYEGWKYWMVELLAVACLSIASKFGETTHLSFWEIQMEDLDHLFESSLIQRMELRVLEVLEWRLSSVTPYTYIELLLYDIHDPLDHFLPPWLIDRVADMLLATLSDSSELVAFRPCVTAISALRCVTEEALPTTDHVDQLSFITTLIPQDQKDHLAICYKIMKANMGCSPQNPRPQTHHHPPSPVTVLTMQKLHISNHHVDLSFIRKKIPTLNLNLHTKRKREEES